MCFNAETSIISFIFTLIFCILLILTKNNTLKCLGIFFIYVALMQFIEFLLWINKKKNNFNKILQKILNIYLYLQPLVLAITQYILKLSIFPYFLLFCIIIYIIISIVYIKNILKSKYKYINIKSPLVWNIIKFNKYTNSYYILLIISLLTFNSDNIYSIVSLIISSITLYINKLFNKSWYSYWCFSINIIPFILYLIYKLN